MNSPVYLHKGIEMKKNNNSKLGKDINFNRLTNSTAALAVADNVPGGFRKMYSTETIDPTLLPAATTTTLGMTYSNNVIEVSGDYPIQLSDLPVTSIIVFANISSSNSITLTLPSGLTFLSNILGNTSTTIVLPAGAEIALVNIATAVAIVGYTAAGSNINVLDPTTSAANNLNSALANIASGSSSNSTKFFFNAKVSGLLGGRSEYVSFGNNMYMLTEYGTGIYYSYDGQLWIQSNITSGNFSSPSFGNSTWVVSSVDGNGVYYSTDGINWTITSITSGSCEKATYANGKWVMSKVGGGIYYSSDAITWTLTNISSGTGGQAAYGNGVWVIGMDGSTGALYSTDGITWTSSTLTGVSTSKAIFGNGIFVIAVFSAGLRTSTDGINWTTTNISSGSANTLYFGNGIFVLGLNASGALQGIYYATNPTTFTQSNINSILCRGVAYANGSWVAALDTGLYYGSSPAFWTKGNIGSITYSVASGNNTFICGTMQGCYFTF